MWAESLPAEQHGAGHDQCAGQLHDHPLEITGTEDLSDSPWKPRTTCRMVLDPDSVTDQQFSLSAMSVMALLLVRLSLSDSLCHVRV